LYENGKMKPVETITGMGEYGDKEVRVNLQIKEWCLFFFLM
jgi:hypothetical protein